MSGTETWNFRPGTFLGDGELPQDTRPPSLLILNQPIASFDVLARLWKHSRYRICADGGANRLYDMFEGAREPRRCEYLPDSIHGDLDSLRDDVRNYYASCGVDVSQNPDQYSTDFGKAMVKVASKQPSQTQKDVLVLGSLAGRVDQGLGLLHEMIREEDRNPALRLFLVSESNVSFILKSGRNVIEGLKSSRFFTQNIGLLPVYGPSIITTSGLEWDVHDWKTQMGTQVSTSNHVMVDHIHVETDTAILFTIERSEMPVETGKSGA
ncbi:thiamine pyrophosphokinase-like protein 1 [Lophiostoma macrostomum CBS 122681]|uniref:Thiamine pyrophosphokinase n=1 Tax=Lophiostoma macrostomum CBS 122681 TaxID=1314788 RepID=A0A6A6TDY1_9PLEO|nr:thiamine pyrophosphokinase-like protein 1 [Lophiostoma macrostomum CBS 122681]